MKLKHCVKPGRLRLSNRSSDNSQAVEMRFLIGCSDGGCRKASVWIT